MTMGTVLTEVTLNTEALAASHEQWGWVALGFMLVFAVGLIGGALTSRDWSFYLMVALLIIGIVGIIVSIIQAQVISNEIEEREDATVRELEEAYGIRFFGSDEEKRDLLPQAGEDEQLSQPVEVTGSDELVIVRREGDVLSVWEVGDLTELK